MIANRLFKAFISILVLWNFCGWNFAGAQSEPQLSLAGIMSVEVNVDVTPGDIVKCVSGIFESVSKKYPEILGVNVVYTNAQRKSKPIGFVDTMKFRDRSLMSVLQIVSGSLGYDFKIDLENSLIVFNPPNLGPDLSKIFFVSDQLASKIGIDWSDEKTLVQSLATLGFKGEVKIKDKKRRMFIATDSIEHLHFLDSVIYIRNLLPAGKSIKVLTD